MATREGDGSTSGRRVGNVWNSLMERRKLFLSSLVCSLKSELHSRELTSVGEGESGHEADDELSVGFLGREFVQGDADEGVVDQMIVILLIKPAEVDPDGRGAAWDVAENMIGGEINN